MLNLKFMLNYWALIFLGRNNFLEYLLFPFQLWKSIWIHCSSLIKDIGFQKKWVWPGLVLNWEGSRLVLNMYAEGQYILKGYFKKYFVGYQSVLSKASSLCILWYGIPLHFLQLLQRALPQKGVERYQFKDFCDTELLNMPCTFGRWEGERCKQEGSYMER